MTSSQHSSTEPVTLADPEWLAGRVFTLLAFYYQGDEDPAVLREMARDWIEILGPIPQGAIAEACRTYLRDEPRKRPTPGAIRALAMAAMKNDPRLAPPALPKPREPERVPATDEQRARILAEFGMTERRMAAILGGRRMPPPHMPGYEEPPPAPPLTAEEIAARPYTDAERARMARLRPPAHEEADA